MEIHAPYKPIATYKEDFIFPMFTVVLGNNECAGAGWDGDVGASSDTHCGRRGRMLQQSCRTTGRRSKRRFRNAGHSKTTTGHDGND